MLTRMRGDGYKLMISQVKKEREGVRVEVSRTDQGRRKDEAFAVEKKEDLPLFLLLKGAIRKEGNSYLFPLREKEGRNYDRRESGGKGRRGRQSPRKKPPPSPPQKKKNHPPTGSEGESLLVKGKGFREGGDTPLLC